MPPPHFWSKASKKVSKHFSEYLLKFHIIEKFSEGYFCTPPLPPFLPYTGNKKLYLAFFREGGHQPPPLTLYFKVSYKTNDSSKKSWVNT